MIDYPYPVYPDPDPKWPEHDRPRLPYAPC